MSTQGEPGDRGSGGPEPARELSDPGALKALGHPLRQQILRSLHRDGPATATTLAAALGENTGATSYHLRQLAEHGFVEDIPERARGRVRWWRARRQDIRFLPRSTMTEDARAALDQLTELNAAEDDQALARFQQRREEMGPWGDALLFSRSALRLAPHELLAFWEEYMALVLRYRGDDAEGHAVDPPPQDARRILVRFLAFPDVD
ncbi:winged helix-turn-helix domain-containing protein [Pseudonocardia humida]|uniref:Helix-turn-helix transcriptional regulator n=1 Tax=Pseudonocardia humida TaxID=2800819 RepID=A0ABT1A668_9PSEU|nr:helix-turn-helix domain-containing protein [Pseudonocardia humida]MCO1658319.1 helix-turn-helix transcriptional regulator [Pseudonocardia humida]